MAQDGYTSLPKKNDWNKMIRIPVFLLSATLLGTSPTMAQSAVKGQQIAALWDFKSNFEDGKSITRTYGSTSIGRLVPRNLYFSKSAIVASKGKEILPAGSAFGSTTDAKTFCEPKRIAGKANVVCVIDTDNDGKVDSYFKHSSKNDITQTLVFGSLKSLSTPTSLEQETGSDNKVYFDVDLHLSRTQLDIKDPGIFLYTCVKGDQSKFLKSLGGIYGKLAENCTYMSRYAISSYPVIAYLSGFSVEVTKVTNNEMTFSMTVNKKI
jgi:hypothetical protein